MNLHRPEPARFTACPSYRPGETGQSYLGRLTAFFGCPSPKEFCKDYLLELQGIQHGEPEALQRLAAMTGADPDELVRSTPRRIDKHFMVLNGETLHTRVNPRHRISICPLCAREDIAANPDMPLDQAVHGRREWMVGLVDCCVIHNVRLVARMAPVATAEKLDVNYETGMLLGDLDDLPVVPAVPDEFQLYALSRIGAAVARPSPLLDGLPLVTVAQLCHAAGHDLLRHRGHAGVLDDRDRWAAGFEMLGHGKDGFERAVVELRRAMLPGETAIRILGRLMEYLHEAHAYRRDLGDFPDAVIESLFRLLPYGPGQAIAGRRCEVATLLEFLEVRRIYGVTKTQLRDFIDGTPELAVQVGPGVDNVLVDRVVADRVFVGRTPFITGMDMIRLMGRERVHARRVLGDLVEVGILAPEAGASRGDRAPIYSQPAAVAAMAAFVERFEAVDPLGPGMVGLDTVTGSYGVTSQDLWRLLASGEIRKMGMIAEDGFLAGMRLDADEVVSALSGVRAPMRVADVAGLLEVPQAAVRNLVASGNLERAPGRTGVSTRLVLVFDTAVVDAFHAEFISANALRKLAGSQFAVGVMVGQGLKPAIVLDGLAKSEDRAVFYRRAEVVEKL